MTEKPIARHIKRGTTYDIVGPASLQTKTPLCDMDQIVIYRCRETGMLWARSFAEFYDGRFEIIRAIPQIIRERYYDN